MPWLRYPFTINVTGEGIYFATKEHLLEYGYVPDPEWVPEVYVTTGEYGFILEAPETRRGCLRATGVIRPRGTLVIGDFTHILPEKGWLRFIHEYDNKILSGNIRQCANLYIGQSGEYNVVLTLNSL